MTESDGAHSFRKRVFDVCVKHGRILLLGVLVTAVVFATSHLAPKRVPILGYSMEPTLMAPRFYQRCPQCRQSFVLLFQVSSAEQLQSRILAGSVPRVCSCPSCGFTEVPFDPTHDSISEVAVRRSGPHITRRGVLLAFLDEQGVPAVKRVAGLPGERLEIRNGDLYVNGKIVVKSVAETMKQAVRLDSIEPVREDGILRFVHRRAVPWSDPEKRSDKKIDLPVTNELETAIIGAPRADVENVRDFILEFDCIPPTANGIAPVVLYYDGQRQYRIAIQTIRRETHIRVICCDRRIRICLGNDTVSSVPLDETAGLLPVVEPFRIDIPHECVRNATVFRDIHYSIPANGRAVFDIPPNEYVLLGDNSPVSHDSRVRNRPTVSSRDILGTVHP